MNLLGFEFSITRGTKKALTPADNRGGWWPVIREFMPGAWQANVEVSLEDSLRYWAVFRCISIISSDVAKMRLRLVEQDSQGIWAETDSPAFSPVIRKPNSMQTRIQFYENWMTSKLSRGNTYVLKVRDARGVVTGLHILDPHRVTPLIADNGDVFYQLNRDNVAGILTDIPAVPASEIIHDRWNCLYHPLCGLSPVYAVGINALSGLRAESNSARFFANGARPSGVLTAPGAIGDATAKRAKDYWDENFTGANAGKVAVLGDGLTYQQMTMSAVDAQLIEQLKWNDATIAGAFGVPAFMINSAAAPATANVEAVNQMYYSQCLQIHVEAIELLLDEGLGLVDVTGRTLGTEFDLDGLLRMDTATKVRAAAEGIKGVFKPNEVRARFFDLPPVTGGDTVYLQQQNFSLEALNKRDQREDPFGSAAAGPQEPEPAAEPVANDNEIGEEAARYRRDQKGAGGVSKFDGAAFGAQVIEAVKGYVQPLREALDAAKAENAALVARIADLEARAPIPGPQGGPGLPGNDGAPGLDGRDGAPGLQGDAGQDGRDGQNGRDGQDGAAGADGATGERGEKGLDGKDGRDGQPGVPGRDGKDGLGFDDFQIEHDGQRGFTFRLARGDRTKEFAFTLPIVIDQGVWKERGYEKGDGVTWRGSFWIAQRETSSKPDEANADWRLAVKRGRDGKDAVRMGAGGGAGDTCR